MRPFLMDVSPTVRRPRLSQALISEEDEFRQWESKSCISQLLGPHDPAALGDNQFPSSGKILSSEIVQEHSTHAVSTSSGDMNNESGSLSNSRRITVSDQPAGTSNQPPPALLIGQT